MKPGYITVFGIAAMQALAASAWAADNAKAAFSGKASWYGAELHGHKTASGKRYDMNKLTAAHRTLPFGTRVQVTNCKNGKCCIVEINDRGPHVGRRVIDISKEAARQLGIFPNGEGYVACKVLPAEKKSGADANKTSVADLPVSNDTGNSIEEQKQEIAQRPYPLIE